MSVLIDKYLSKSDIDNLNSLQKSILNKLVNVTCMGLYNHGKSSLLNALIDDLEDSTFKTADVRETTISKSFEYNNINFVDTPGLNAKEHDDKRVLDAVKESDINIFVHTVTTGEFVEKEIEFLQHIKTNWNNPKDFIDRTIFVLSRVDKANNQNDISSTINKMQNQILEIFGLESIIIPVSALRYKKGMLEGKNILIKKSNIVELENNLNKLISKNIDFIMQTREQRLSYYYDNLLENIESKKQQKMFELAKQKQVKDDFLKSLDNDIFQIESTLEKMYKRLGE